MGRVQTRLEAQPKDVLVNFFCHFSIDEKVRCQEQADETTKTINLANRLVNGLASEKVRWTDSVEKFREQAKMLPGDVLLVASLVSYLGCFTKQYRLELFERKWLPHLKKLPKPICTFANNEYMAIKWDLLNLNQPTVNPLSMPEPFLKAFS